MKKLLVLLLFTLLGFSAMCFNMSCSANRDPSAPNFQSPIQTIVAINPTITPTFSFTPLPPTPTPTITATSTPFVSTVWGSFSGPSGVCVDSTGNVYVADTGNNVVKKFTSGNVLITSWGDGGKGKGKISFTTPKSVAVDSTGLLYVVGSGTNCVNKHDALGNFLTQFTSANGTTFAGPQGVAVDSANNVYVSDTGNNRVVKMNSIGVTLTGFGTSGIVTLTVSPYGLAVDSNFNVAVAASDNTVRFFNSTGTLVTTIPGFVGPNDVSFDSGNNLYVADAGNRQIEEFSTLGLTLPPINIFNDGGLLVSPKGIAISGTGTIYVTDAGGTGVFVFAP
ncbi:MAG TPA: 6-bladed beta-propeller [bacterium]